MRSRHVGLSSVALIVLGLSLPAPAAAQMRPAYPPPYAYRYGASESDLRLAVTPREASVYVDGYFAGHVDDYDGMFQRLHVESGAHEVTIYLKGYRSIREKLYLSPNATRKISGKLEPLSAGESDEPLPVPVNPPNPPSSAPTGANRPGV